MAELFKRAGMNASHPGRGQQRQAPNSPSLDSDILSSSALPSSIAEFDGDGSGWVIFSPQIPVNELNDPLEHIEPLDLSHSKSTVISSQPEEHGLDGSLQIPFHNGEGDFQNQSSSSRLDLFERVNAWRMEQSAILDEDLGAPSTRPSRQQQDTVWQKLKHNASWGLGRYLAWDDEALDALFSKDYGLRQQQQNQSRREGYRRTHLSRARAHGPPSWEDHMMKHTLYRDRPESNPGLLVALLSRLIMWSRNPDLLAEQQRQQQPNSLRGSNSPLHALVHPEHSYHLDVIQRSIATLTSTVAGAPWSDTWETGTSTSIGVAAA